MIGAPTLAWHYTTGHCAASIVDSEYIRPATAYVPQHERPVVWFSRLTRWEPTASKWLIDPQTKSSRVATLEEMDRLAGGLYRFGVDASELLRLSTLASAARIRKRDVRALEESGRRAGAAPSLWMGALADVHISRVAVIQRLICGAWISDPSELSGAAINTVAKRAKC